MHTRFTTVYYYLLHCSSFLMVAVGNASSQTCSLDPAKEAFSAIKEKCTTFFFFFLLASVVICKIIKFVCIYVLTFIPLSVQFY